MTLTYDLLTFEQFTPQRLHDVLRLRTDVFVVEQRCAYPEVDGHDPSSLHLLGLAESELAAYCRWFEEPSHVVLGRIVVDPRWRGRGWGRAITREALHRIGPRPVRVHAQSRLEAFYRELGFAVIGSEYDDFGVPHVRMDRWPGRGGQSEF